MKTKYFMLLLSLFCLSLWAYPQGSWTKTSLSALSAHMGVASLGSKIYFAGGYRSPDLNNSSDVVEIYDSKNGTWSFDRLSEAREFPAGVSCGSKIFFAGGGKYQASLPGYTYSATVDIYDTITHQWTKAVLSQPRSHLAALSNGKQLLFAGGEENLPGNLYKYHSRVDIYNMETEQWSAAELSKARFAMGYAVAGGKAFFAGGIKNDSVTNRVDIYDFAAKKWSTDTLSIARCLISATAVGSKVFFGGGMVASEIPTDRVDVFDTETGKWSITHLSVPRAFGFTNHAATICGMAVFAGGGSASFEKKDFVSASDVVDMYDPAKDNWTSSRLTYPRFSHSVASAGNQLLVAGGVDLNYIYKTVDIFTCTTTSLERTTVSRKNISIYPNPATDKLTILLPEPKQRAEIKLYDPAGRIVREVITGYETVELDIQDLDRGVYLVQVSTDGICDNMKIILINN